MSYILDALKKSEKERQRGTVPDLMTAQDVIEEGPKRRSLWPYLLVGALILNAGLLAWWLAWRSGKPPVAAQPPATQQRVAKAPDQENRSADAGSAVPPSPSKLPQATEPAPRSAAEKKPVSRPEVPAAGVNVPPVDVIRQPRQDEMKTDMQRNKENKPAPHEKGLSGIASLPPQQTPAVKHSDAESEQAALPPPAPNKLYSLQELPASLRQGLPDFAISTHLFSSDVSSRMVRINGQLLREGEFLNAGLKLEEITFEGVVFSYQKYRFRIGLK
jgi:general secretion pathway protein B